VVEDKQKQEETYASDIKSGYNDIDTRTSYDVLCDLNNELMKKMKEYSESLYAHCVLIGDLSYRAAKEVGANEQLAMAGGYYHEIGKIRGKNYIEEGLTIAEEYSFPKELKAILKEHNIKYEKPNSVEAAIVMLSDNVVSTIDYIEKTEDHKYTTDKIIDNIFIMRMDKGTFDASSISLKDFKKLKEFYQKEFRNKNI
jgi:putative nucleotidyltransferase with HDIG domain